MENIALNHENSITLEATRQNLGKAREFIAKGLEGGPFDQRLNSMLILAVDEALSHIISYSEIIAKPHEIRLGFSLDETRFIVRIQDSLTDFSNLLSSSDTQDASNQFDQGQLGIYLIRQIVDEVKYIYRRGLENELILLKFVL